jgi:hypothetical protein
MTDAEFEAIVTDSLAYMQRVIDECETSVACSLSFRFLGVRQCETV